MNLLVRAHAGLSAGHSVDLVGIRCVKGTEASSSDFDRRFKVALLTPGPISDQSWNGGAYQGLMRIRDSLGAQVSHIQTKTPAEFEENSASTGRRGTPSYSATASSSRTPRKRVAPEFPKTIYVTTSGTTSGPNLAGMTFGFADASYLAGMLAASMTKTNKLGVIGGTELPPVVESFRAFQQGAREVNPGHRDRHVVHRQLG